MPQPEPTPNPGPMPQPMPMGPMGLMGPMPEPMPTGPMGPMPEPMPMGPMPMPMPMPMPTPQPGPFNNLGPFKPLGALCKWVPTSFPFGSFSLPPWCRALMGGNGFLPMVQEAPTPIVQEPQQNQLSIVGSPGFGPFPFPTNWCQDYWSKSKCERNKKKGHYKGRGKRSRKTQNQCLKTCQFC